MVEFKKALYMSGLFLALLAMTPPAYSLSIANKNVRSFLSGQKAVPLNRKKGISLQQMRSANRANAIPLVNQQHYRYKKSDDYDKAAVEEKMKVEPFAHLQKKVDPFGMEAKNNPFFDMKKNGEEKAKSAIIRDQTRSEPYKKVPLSNAMQEQFSPELERSDALMDEVTYHHRWPIEEKFVQRVSSDFGPRQHPVTGEMAFHAGIDIAAKQGTPVRASMDGKINATGFHARLGNYVRIDHPDGTYSLYGHLKNQKVKDGQVVLQGEVIGSVGSTGRSTGPHLDYSLRRNSQPMNPMEILAIPGELKTREVSSLQ